MDELTTWELIAAANGWKAANCPEVETMMPLTDDEHDRLMEKYG